jgi:3'-phosphoadenosine 5'-phosphosulfate sulfotransferase (PAPS reductase)/FAD synthetase
MSPDRLDLLLLSARQLIACARKHCPLGVIFWSGGKDSMVLLHLLRSEGIDLPVAFFREPWQPRKYAFHDQLIRDWNLHVLSWHPSDVAFQQTGDEVELQNIYAIDTFTITCPTGIVPAEVDLPWACAVDMAGRPTQAKLEVRGPIQCAWIGHKGCDTDAVLGGDAGTRIGVKQGENGTTVFFLLKDWTHEDIWEYIERFEVPYDAARYEKVDGVWRERPDRRHNADYVHACTACVDSRPDAPKFVHCPRFGTVIENCSAALPWTEPQKLSYMEDAAIGAS